MNLLKEIFDWVKTLPLWQQDAARRLYEKPNGLTNQDYREIYTLALKENALDNGTEELVPRALDDSQIQRVGGAHALIINSLGQLNHVNRIDPGQTIKFARNGLSIIYGENGTGKSGYARVFKRACFCRDKESVVLPDVAKESEVGATPSAVFNVEYDGVVKDIKWKQGYPSGCGELSLVSVFDSTVARLSISPDQEVHYVPYGMDVLEKLGSEVLLNVKERLKAEANSIDLKEDIFAELLGDHEVGRTFKNLPSADLLSIHELGSPTEEHKKRGLELRKILDESNLQDRIRNTELAITRIEAVEKRIGHVCDCISDDALAGYAAMTRDLLSAKEAAALAAKNLTGTENLLAGTGDCAWKRMFAAAIDFIADKHEGSSLLSLDKCPLCQQSMSEEARSRIKRFEDFISNEMSRSLEKAETACSKAIKDVSDVTTGEILPDTTKTELVEVYPQLTDEHAAFLASFERRRDCVLQALKGVREWEKMPRIDLAVLATLSKRKDELGQSIVRMKAIMVSAKREEAEKEIQGLRARFMLHKKLPTVDAWFARKERKAKLMQLHGEIQGRIFTQKVKELSEKAISEPLCMAVRRECEKLGLDRMPNLPEFFSRGKQSKLVSSFALKVANPQPVGRVLSEGEQKALAIAAFLGELAVSGHNHAIVFDDPMTSLDYFKRREIASRLVQESGKRQVILFSHEPAFVSLLVDLCEQHGVEHVVHSLSSVRDVSGVVTFGPKWVLKKYSERIDSLEKQQAAMARDIVGMPTDEEVQQLRFAYAKLRETIESVVQNYCLMGTVQRFQNYINVKSMLDIQPLDDGALKDIYALYLRCSNFIDGHDHSNGINEAPPTPEELRADIARLKNAIAQIKATRTAAKVTMR